MHMGFSRTLAAALAAALAVPAVAQTRAADEARRAAEERRSTDEARRTAERPGAPAPAPAPGQAQQGQQHQLSQEQYDAIAVVMAWNNLGTRVGDLATTRASTPELQALARTIAEDHRRIQQELEPLVRERGLGNVVQPPATAVQERIEGEFQRLNSLTGPEFDREFNEFLTRNGNTFVDSLKRARDITPGKDAQLKKFLDDAENTEENHLTAARQVKANRQARTPPAR
jgi:putative membrane protein